MLSGATRRLLSSAAPSAAGPATQHIQYLHHVPTTPLQKILVAATAAVSVFANPERGDMLAALGDSTGEVALRQMHLKMCSDPTGMKILAEKPRIRSTVTDVDALRSLPKETFGYAYTQFMDAHGFEADGRSHVRFVDDPELAYVLQRYRELHDFWHVLFGLPPTVFGELALKYVELVQTGLPVCTLSGFVGPLRLNCEERKDLFSRYIPWAYRAGKEAPFLMNVYYEQEYQTKLEDLRARLNIRVAPPVNP
ncbi:ubiquinone biosynthesis protein COQ4 [Thraustotheca clavata]|uniref:Ubiquinone biosynthesis protein COQ4 homolog, mitochondrial n=1 Tax=Thraustotheca clavata TaxID=74557 RepID=A0A1V9ZFX7_9STRA|nr:ubiquinone biosynthesis protein COQ4 [Thraustotheca clavata]